MTGIDGLPAPAPALPPPGGTPPAPASYAGSALPQQPFVRQPPGRPALDPEVQEAKVRSNAEVKRLERMLPKQVDSKLQIFQLKRGQSHLTSQQKPVIVLTASEIEAEIAQGHTADDVIEAAITQKGFTGGRFLCRYIDRTGKTIPQIPMWEVGEEDPNAPQDSMNDLEQPLSDRELDALLQTDAPYGYSPAQQPAPPPPAAVDPTTIARVARDERNDERGRGLELVQVVTAQSNTLLTVLTQMSASQQAAAERARQEEAARRANFLQTLMTMIPLILPVLQGMFKREPVAAPAETTTERMMLELLRAKLTEKPPEGSPMDKMMEMLLLTSKAQMELQSSGARSVFESQAQIQGALMKNVVEMVKEMKPGGGDKDDGLEKYLPLLAPLAEKFLNGQQAPAPAAAPPPPAPPQQRLPQPTAARRRPATPPAPAAAPPAARPLPPHRQNTRRLAEQMTPEQRVSNCLVTIQGLSTGQIPATQRLQAMHYVIDTATPELLGAIDSGDMNAVIKVGQPVVMAVPSLIQWIAAEHHQSFLREACADIRLLRAGQMTRERLDVGVRTTAAFTAQYHDHIQTIPERQPQPQAPVTPAGPVTPNGPPVAALIVDPPPAPPKRPPPTDNGMVGGPAEPTAPPAPPPAPGGATLSGPPPVGESMMTLPPTQAPPPPAAAPAAPGGNSRRRRPPPPAAGAQGATSPPPTPPTGSAPTMPQTPPEPG
jgi:hypothetical protein